MNPGDGRISLWAPEDRLGLDTILLGRVESVGKTSNVRGLGKSFYSANVLIHPGNRRIPNVPVLSPYVRGRYGQHIGIVPGSFCVVEIMGQDRQAFITGFLVPMDEDGSFGGGDSGRPPIGADDWIYSVPGIGRGVAFRMISGTGFILDVGTKGLKRAMDPTREAIEDFCRNYRLTTPSGFISWSEGTRRDRRALYQLTMFQRAKSSLDGAGGFVDFQYGSVRKKSAGGSQVDPDDTMLARFNFNNRLRVEIEEDGETRVVGPKTVNWDMTRDGETAPSKTGISTLVTAIDGDGLEITAGGIFHEMAIFHKSTDLAAIVREINDNVPEVLAALDLNGAIVVTSKDTGIGASLLIVGTAATKLGLSTGTPLLGSEGTGADSQDWTQKIGGMVQIDVGKKSGVKRKFRLTITNDGQLTLDADDKATFVLDPLTGDMTVKCTGKFKIEGQQESELVVPSLKIGNKDVGTSLAKADSLAAKLEALRAEQVNHGHVYVPGTSGTATSAPPLPFTEHQKPITEADFDSDVKVPK